MSLTADYNYHSFSFALDQPELDRWLKDGPATGKLAPDFELEDLDSRPVRLQPSGARPSCSSSAPTPARSSPTGSPRWNASRSNTPTRSSS